MSIVCHTVKRLDTPHPGLLGAFTVYGIKILVSITPAGMVSLNLTQPGVTREEWVNEGLSDQVSVCQQLS